MPESPLWMRHRRRRCPVCARSIPAPTWLRWGVSPAVGRSTARTARRWRSRSILSSPRARCAMWVTPWRWSSPIPGSRPVMRPRRSSWTTTCCPAPPPWLRPRRPPRRWCMTAWPATCATTGISARRPPWKPPSPRPRIAWCSRPRTTAWCPMPWNRAQPSATMTRRPASTPSTPPARTRTSSAC